MSVSAKERLYWTVPEAAAYIGFHPITVYGWIKKAEKAKTRKKPVVTPIPPYILFGRWVRIPIEPFKVWATTASHPAHNDRTAP